MIIFKNKGPHNISLIGFMGSGKSVIGKEISKVYKVEHYDTDNEIEKDTGDSINEIFSNYGEKYFRSIEEKKCISLLKKKHCIISLGGGSITNFKVRQMIKKYSFSIYLKVNKDILLKRLTNSKKRPLLKDFDKEKIVNKLLQERKKFYNEANLVIENNFDKKEIIKEIVENIKNI